MKAGILAAGEGSRLQGTGPPVLKPLLEIRGKSLIYRTIENLAEAGAEDIQVIVNEDSVEVRDRVLALPLPVPVRFVVRSTPSSMHSLLVLRPYFGDQAALVSMVDSILPPGALAGLARRARSRRRSDGTLALTSFVDDEKPVCVRMAGDRITELGTRLPGARWVTAGIYYFTPRVWPELDRAEALGLSKMRNFLGHLVETGFRLHGHRLPKTVDVDRPHDVRAAEEYLALWERKE
ncbi:MAG TPA: NTP transferase domain-containing protein [Candidatus Saccharimonadales bacterium]|nr:NTP transferase domain-containing protein [Candidatus Saccharimonadales bacterium]